MIKNSVDRGRYPVYTPPIKTLTTTEKDKTMTLANETLSAVVDGIIVRLEDDGYPVTIISCRCPETGNVEDFTYPSDYFDIYRFQDQWNEIQPSLFAEIAEGVAADFVQSREEA